MATLVERLRTFEKHAGRRSGYVGLAPVMREAADALEEAERIMSLADRCWFSGETSEINMQTEIRFWLESIR